MDYMQEDPYSGHRFAPHDPYYSGGSGGGGGYDGNYAINSSFDRHSEHSIHSDRNRPAKNYVDVPNGGPYGSSNNMYVPEHQQMRASPQPPRSLSPPDYGHPSMDGGVRGPYERESPYHNLPPYDDPRGGGGPEIYDRGYYEEPEYNHGDPSFDPHIDPRSGDYLPPQSPHHYAEEDLHDDFGQR